MTTYIAIADSLQRRDVLIVVLWLFSAIVRISTYQFAAAYGWSQLFRIQRWHYVNAVLLIAVFIGVVIPERYTVASVDFTTRILEPIVYPYLLIIGPTVLYGIARIKAHWVQNVN